MTTLPDRPQTALLVIDVQNDVMANGHRRDDVIANINTLVERARAPGRSGDLGAALRRREPDRGHRRLAVRAGAAA